MTKEPLYIISGEQHKEVKEFIKWWTTAFRNGCSEKDRERLARVLETLGNVERRPYNPEAEKQPSYQDLVDFARWTQTFWKHGIEIMRKNNLVIATDSPMEKLAFTFYTDLCEIDSEARHLFQEGYKEENYRNESDIEYQTIKEYPKPYEDRLKQAAVNAVLDKFMNKIVSSRFLAGEDIVVRISDIRIIREELRQQTGQTSAEQQRGRGV